jgi:S1-C subfamily serine protease
MNFVCALSAHALAPQDLAAVHSGLGAMVQKFQPEENLANSGVENRENRHDSNVCDPLLELNDKMSEGARDFDQDLNRYSPRDRVAARLEGRR